MTGSTHLAVTEVAPIAALLITFLVHVVGAVALLWALLGDDGWGQLRDWWPRDGRHDEPEPREPEPQPSGSGLALPLPDAAPSPVRLREPGRVGDAHPRPPRRPEHAPEPARPPERV